MGCQRNKAMDVIETQPIGAIRAILQAYRQLLLGTQLAGLLMNRNNTTRFYTHGDST
jgi:hypothetical protein